MHISYYYHCWKQLYCVRERESDLSNICLADQYSGLVIFIVAVDMAPSIMGLDDSSQPGI